MRRQEHKALVAILALFWLWGLIYDSSTPLFEGLDELWHYAVVEHLAAGGGLPVQQPGVDPPWKQEGNQPPLYYALTAAAVTWIDRGDYWAHRFLYSEDLTMGDPFAAGEKFYFYHTRAQDFPYRRTTLAVHLARWLSMLMASGTVGLTYAFARELWPDRPAVAPLSAALTAFNPEFLFISAQVNNDNLSILLATAAAYLLARLWKRGFSGRLSGAIAVVAGLMALTKLNGLVMLLVTALAASLRALRGREWRAWLLLGALGAGATALIAGWWYARNVVLYGDPFALDVMDSYFGSRSLTLWETLREYKALHFSYWGVFGIANIVMPGWLYVVYAALEGLALVGLALWLWRRRRTPWPPWLLPALHSVVVVASVFYWAAHSTGLMGRLAFTAICSISSLLALGLLTLAPRPYRRALAGVVSGAMAALALVAPWVSLWPTYAPAMRRPPLARACITAQYPFEAYVGDVLALRGYDLAGSTQEVAVTLHWEVLARTDEHLIIFVHLLDERDNFIAGHDDVPMSNYYPAQTWGGGEWLADRHLLRTPEGFAPGEYSVRVGVYRYRDGARLPALSAAGAPYQDNVIGLPEHVVINP